MRSAPWRAARRSQRCARTGCGCASAGRELRADVRAAEDPAQLGPQDLVVVAVKGPAMPDVAARIAPLLGPGTMVLTAMNGVPWWFFSGMPGPCAGLALRTLDPAGAIAAAIPFRHVIGCVVHASCTSPEPGVVQHVMGQALIIGEPPAATRRARRRSPRRSARPVSNARCRSASSGTSGTSCGAT